MVLVCHVLTAPTDKLGLRYVLNKNASIWCEIMVKLGLTDFQMTIENSKNGKRVHILFLYIIDVDGRLFALF
jgi:hypothetical protein